MTRRIYPTRFGQMHLRSNEGKGVPLVLLHMSPRSGAMWELLQEKLERPTYAPDRLGYGYSDAPPWALSLEQYALSTVDALRAAGVEGDVDLLGYSRRFHRGHRDRPPARFPCATGRRRRDAAVFTGRTAAADGKIY